MKINSNKQGERHEFASDRAVIANRERGNGSIVFVAPRSFLEHEMRECSDRLDDLGLDDAPAGISIWEGRYVQGERTFEGDYNDPSPVGAFRAPTDDEWAAIREGRNPFVSPGRDICRDCGDEIDPATCHCGEATDAHGFGSGHSPVPMGCTCHLQPDVDDPNESAEAWGFGDHKGDNGNPDFEAEV